jgi:hypothetical protein
VEQSPTLKRWNAHLNHRPLLPHSLDDDLFSVLKGLPFGDLVEARVVDISEQEQMALSQHLSGVVCRIDRLGSANSIEIRFP